MCKQITFREADKILVHNGFRRDKIKGSHHHYVRSGRRVVINLKLNQMVWQRLCKENELNIE